MSVRWLSKIRAILGAFLASSALVPCSHAAEFVVYNVYRPVDLGIPGETPEKDYYVNMGAANGLRPGTTLNVYRRMPTYDLVNEKLYQDITFKIATLKVIHVEGNAAVARLDKFVPTEKTPSLGQRYVMIGDYVRPGSGD